ncbi:MAG: response regulator [Deltaproteobacteria bacterium]|nr:response regulator [Deltaproteobacteria bacterium]
MGKKILIVDDSTIMRKMIRTTLQNADHVVVGEAKDGNGAIELYKSIKPDLVTMDITMRGMDGFTAANKILNFDHEAKIIFLSNLNQADYSENARELGAKGYLNKHSTEEILELINEL